jgi:hypothetical protein
LSGTTIAGNSGYIILALCRELYTRNIIIVVVDADLGILERVERNIFLKTSMLPGKKVMVSFDSHLWVQAHQFS